MLQRLCRWPDTSYRSSKAGSPHPNRDTSVTSMMYEVTRPCSIPTDQVLWGPPKAKVVLQRGRDSHQAPLVPLGSEGWQTIFADVACVAVSSLWHPTVATGPPAAKLPRRLHDLQYSTSWRSWGAVLLPVYRKPQPGQMQNLALFWGHLGVL